MYVSQWISFLVFVGVALLTTDAAADAEKKRSRFGKPKKNPSVPKPPPPKLNTDNLPTIDVVLESVGLGHRLPHFVKQGITETRFMLRMTPTDFNMMVSYLSFVQFNPAQQNMFYIVNFYYCCLSIFHKYLIYLFLDSTQRFDIEGYDVKEFKELQELIKTMIIDATVVDIPPRQDLIDREKLRSGRVYLPKFPQSFEVCI
jgi:hypothetical protein